MAAYEIPGQKVSHEAAADLSSYIYCGVVLNSSGDLAVATAGSVGTNEVQKVTVATTGNTTVGFQGVTAAATAIAADAGGATTLAGLLAGLPDLETEDFSIAVGADADDGKLIVTFKGRWEGKDVPALTATGTGASVATSTAGGSGSSTTSTKGQNIYGVLQNKPRAAGHAATVMINGTSKAVAGAAIPLLSGGTPVKTTAGGRFVPASEGDVVAGYALTAADANGDLIALQFHAA